MPSDPTEEQRVLEIVFGPCTRNEADEQAMKVQELLDRHAPGVASAVGVRYSAAPPPNVRERELEGLLERALHVLQRAETRIDADCSGESPLRREIRGALEGTKGQ